EDPGRNFLPAPGAVTSLRWPDGPGVRVDAGVETGSVIGGNFDSLLAKIIITGADRTEALERARRALGETAGARVACASVSGCTLDSLLERIIITGADRTEALERARRALDETVVEGIATVL